MAEKRRARIGRLTTVGEVAAELGKLYRKARWEEVAVGDASRLATILSAMRQCLEASDLERKVAQLEERLAAGPNNVLPFKRQA